MENIMKSSELVQLIRINCQITQGTLAQWSNIDQGSISQYELGNRKPGLLRKKILIDIANKHAGVNINLNDIKD